MDAVKNQMEFKTREISEMQSQLAASIGELERLKIMKTQSESKIAQVRSSHNTDDLARQCETQQVQLDQIRNETQNNQKEVENEREKKQDVVAKIKAMNKILGRNRLNSRDFRSII